MYGINEASSAGLVKNLMWAEKWDEALTRAEALLKENPDKFEEALDKAETGQELLVLRGLM